MKSRREIVYVILCLHLYGLFIYDLVVIQMNGKRKSVTKQTTLNSTPLTNMNEIKTK